MTGIKMSDFVATKSDRLNAEDLMGGPIRVRVTGVKAHPMREDGPVSLNYENDNGKPFMPCKSMRRVLLRAWGDDTSAYVGRELVLFRNPEVQFGKDKTGGVRISHMSHIGNGVKVVLQVSKGRMGEYAVAGLKDTPAAATSPAAAANTPSTDAGQSTGAASNEAHDKAADWLGGYIAALAECLTQEDVMALRNKSSGALTKLAKERPELSHIATDASTARYEALGDATVEMEF